MNDTSLLMRFILRLTLWLTPCDRCTILWSVDFANAIRNRLPILHSFQDINRVLHYLFLHIGKDLIRTPLKSSFAIGIEVLRCWNLYASFLQWVVRWVMLQRKASLSCNVGNIHSERTGLGNSTYVNYKYSTLFCEMLQGGVAW